MEKMPETSSAGLPGGAGQDAAQIRRRLRSTDKDILIDELAALTEQMADGTGDPELIQIYLDILDEKDPLPFDIQPEDALETFRERHSLLLDETEEEGTSHRKITGKGRIPLQIAASIAAVLLCGSAIARACGVDVWSWVAHWTSDIFWFEAEKVPYAEIHRYPIEEGETQSYASLQEAIDAFGITEPLAPTWVPERFTPKKVFALRDDYGVVIHADYVSDTGSLSIIFETQHKGNPTIVEIDEVLNDCLIFGNIRHYLLSNRADIAAIWNNGIFECFFSGDITEQEATDIIRSIYERRDPS